MVMVSGPSKKRIRTSACCGQLAPGRRGGIKSALFFTYIAVQDNNANHVSIKSLLRKMSEKSLVYLEKIYIMYARV